MTEPAHGQEPPPTEKMPALPGPGRTPPLAVSRTPRVPRPEQLEPSARVIPSGDLLGTRNEVLIEHAGSLYRLRLTRNGKLILHK